jgi:aspartyl-tRNA(Asn)/glutamyl-tRNA(Gln) amidotransferase subunit C
MKITDDQVLHVAGLARLALDEHEISKFRKDLDSILEYMDLLSEVETHGDMFMHETPASESGLRPDEVEQGQELTAALSNAPARHEGYIVVPRVIE